MTTNMRAYVLAFVLTMASVAAYLPFAPLRLHDFRAFYCAGQAVRMHADPYREHPLHECERTTTVRGMAPDRDDVTVPAPFPGYALAAFAVLSTVPFPLAALLWIAGSIAAVVGTIVLLGRAIDVPPAVIAIVVGLPAAVVAIPLGQITPFVGLGIALCANALHAGRPRWAAAAALLTALDPAVALVLCAALFVIIRETRATLVAGSAALAALAFLTLGPALNAEYVHTVLHAHALANVGERTQFSTTHFAWAAGLAPGAAMSLGQVWFAIALLVGVGVAYRLRTSYGPVAVALIPPAFAVFGGLYVHFQQLTLAIPAFLYLARNDARAGTWLRAAIFILAVPWLWLTAFPPFAVALAVLAAAYARGSGIGRAALLLSLGSAGLLLVFFGLALANIHGASVPFAFETGANPLAEESWGRYVRAGDARPVPLALLLQTPTVAAMCYCCWLTIGAGLRAGGARSAAGLRGLDSPNRAQ